MTTATPTPRRRAALLAAVMAVLLAGCTGGGSATAPDGWTGIEREEFAFAIPPDWQVRVDEPEDVQTVGTAQVGDSIEAVDARVGNYEGTDVALAAQAALDVFRLSGPEDVETAEEEPVEVAGADEAVRFESTYAAEGAEERIRQWDVFASAEGSTRIVYLSLKAPESVFDEARMTSVLESLEIRL